MKRARGSSTSNAFRVPERYTDLVSGRQVIPPGDWLALVEPRLQLDTLLALSALGYLGLLLVSYWHKPPATWGSSPR